jgi:hypothetical protein
VIKYLIDASVENELILLRSSGINLIRLTSRPIQHVIHEDAEHTINVPIIIPV